MKFAGRVALVTGGGSGIGRATAERLAAEGMKVCVVDLDADAAESVSAGIVGLAVTADVSDPDQLDSAFARCIDAFGRLDVAHLNTGVSLGAGDVAELDVDNYRRSVGVNIDHVVFGTRAAVRAIRRSDPDGGPRAVVATASIAGLEPFYPDAIYTLTKHAVVGFIRAIAPGPGWRRHCGARRLPGPDRYRHAQPGAEESFCSEPGCRSSNPSGSPTPSSSQSAHPWTRRGRAGSAIPASRRCRGPSPPFPVHTPRSTSLACEIARRPIRRADDA